MDLDLPAQGTLIGGAYRVQRVLGSGAMGVVLEAQDETLERKVAIKFIRSSLMDDGFRQRFRGQAQAMARVSHPNMLQIYAFGEHAGAPYFVMEYVDGSTLDEWLSHRRGPPEVGQALQLLEQTCDGVAAIHAASTLHRDLKPSNILIDGHDRARVADLGLAIYRGAEHRGKREIVGTPTYMAPEVAFPEPDEPGAGQRADVYSLGCIAYELLTGRPPFVADGHIAMMFHHATTLPAPPSTRRIGLPTLLDEVVLRALAKRPSDRTPTVEALRAGLHAAAEGLVEPVRILLAEDGDDFRETLQLALEMAFPNAVIDCVKDGRSALDLFDRTRPSVAIIDLQMPELDGLALTALLRARDPNGNVPIIVVTAAGGPAEWKRLSAMGADRFLVKPIVLEDVVLMVRRLVKERTLPRAPSSQPVI
jgi:serine/threonine protein kinase